MALFAEQAYEKELEAVEGSETAMNMASMTKKEKKRSEMLYAILVSVLKNKPLKLLRAIEGKNGFEVWRQLSTQLTPKTRVRSIALLQAYLNHPNFGKDKMTLQEQLLGLARLADEYATVAKEELSENTKLSALMKVMPAALRQHLQLQMTDATTYKEAREKVLSYERTTTSWGSQPIYRELAITKDNKDDEAVLMEIDRVGKGKDKGKSKGKGKDQKGKGKQKGKGQGFYGGFDNKGKGKQQKGKMERERIVKERGKAFLLTRANCVVAGVIGVVNAQ